MPLCEGTAAKSKWWVLLLLLFLNYEENFTVQMKETKKKASFEVAPKDQHSWEVLLVGGLVTGKVCWTGSRIAKWK